MVLVPKRVIVDEWKFSNSATADLLPSFFNIICWISEVVTYVILRYIILVENSNLEGEREEGNAIAIQWFPFQGEEHCDVLENIFWYLTSRELRISGLWARLKENWLHNVMNALLQIVWKYYGKFMKIYSFRVKHNRRKNIFRCFSNTLRKLTRLPYSLLVDFFDQSVAKKRLAILAVVESSKSFGTIRTDRNHLAFNFETAS